MKSSNKIVMNALDYKAGAFKRGDNVLWKDEGTLYTVKATRVQDGVPEMLLETTPGEVIAGAKKESFWMQNVEGQKGWFFRWPVYPMPKHRKGEHVTVRRGGSMYQGKIVVIAKAQYGYFYIYEVRLDEPDKLAGVWHIHNVIDREIS